MAEVIHCPSCNRQLRLADDLFGRLVQCPGCAATFTAGDQPVPRQGPANGTGVRPLSLEARRTVPEGSAADPSRGGPADVRRGPAPRADRDYCPHCDEPVPVGVVACPYCGEFLDEVEDEAERPWEREGAIRRDCEPHRGTLVMVLGIVAVAVSPLAVCCGLLSIPFVAISLSLGFSAWMMGRGDLRKINQRIMDPRGRGQTQAGMICGMVATCVACLSVLGWGAFLLITFARAL